MNPFKNLKQLVNLFTYFFLSILLSCCLDQDFRVNPKNPPEVSNNIVIPESIRLSSAFPAASTDPLAPVLEVDADSIFMIASAYKNIFLSLKSGEAKGFFVKIKGASDYFDVTSTSATFNSGGGPAFGFLMNNGIKAGSFVILYGVYDDENRVSNIVERTVIITESPGKASEFLFKRWKMEKSIYTGIDPNDTTIVGEQNQYNYPVMLDCFEQPDKSEEVTEEYTIQDAEYALAGNGKFTITYNSYYSKNFDELASKNSCSLQYNTKKVTTSFEGQWSYYYPTKRIFLMINRIGINEHGDKVIYNDEMYDYSITTLDNNMMMWKSKDDHDEIMF